MNIIQGIKDIEWLNGSIKEVLKLDPSKMPIERAMMDASRRDDLKKVLKRAVVSRGKRRALRRGRV